MPQTREFNDSLKLVETTVRRFESEAGVSLAPVFYLSLGNALGAPAGERPSVRLEWLSQATHFNRAVRAMQPLLDSLRRHREVREIVLVECEENFDGARCKGETWFVEFTD